MSHSIRKSLLSASVAGLILAQAGTSFAAASSCKFLPVQGECKTGMIRANPSGHFVFFRVSPGANYVLKDEFARQVVASGTAGITGKSKSVFGLYGNEYRLYVDNPFGGFGIINNN